MELRTVSYLVTSNKFKSSQLETLSHQDIGNLCHANHQCHLSALKLVLYDSIFLSTCLATMEKIHCKLQGTCYTLQSWAATCVTLCNVLRLLCGNGAVEKVPGRLQCVTFPRCNFLNIVFKLFRRLYIKNP